MTTTMHRGPVAATRLGADPYDPSLRVALQRWLDDGGGPSGAVDDAADGDAPGELG